MDKKLLREFERQSGIDAYGLGTDRAKWESHLSEFARLVALHCIDIISPYRVRMSRPGEEYLHPIHEIKKEFWGDKNERTN